MIMSKGRSNTFSGVTVSPATEIIFVKFHRLTKPAGSI